MQSITVLSLRLQRLAREVPAEHRDAVLNGRMHADNAIDRMRHLLFDLHPACLDEIDVTDPDIIVETGNDPIAVIMSFVQDRGAELLVIGSRSTGGPGGLGASGPAHRLIQHTHVPGAVVHSGFPPLDAGRFIVGVDAIMGDVPYTEVVGHPVDALIDVAADRTLQH